MEEKDEKIKLLQVYVKQIEDAGKKQNEKFRELKAKYKNLKNKVRVDPRTIEKIWVPEKVMCRKRKRVNNTFSIQRLDEEETIFQALISNRAEHIAKGMFDVLVEHSCEATHCDEKCHDKIKGVTSCIRILRERSKSSPKRFALQRMLWDLRKRIARCLFSEERRTTCAVRLFSAYHSSVSCVEETVEMTINCLRYIYFDAQTRARICRKAVEISNSFVCLSGTIVRVMLYVLDSYVDSEKQKSNVTLKDEELKAIVCSYIQSNDDDLVWRDEFVWRKRCSYNFSSSSRKEDVDENDHETIAASLQIMAIRKGFFWAYNTFVPDMLWKFIMGQNEKESIRALRLLEDLCRVCFIRDPNGTSRVIVNIRSTLFSLLQDNMNSRSFRWCVEMKSVVRSLWNDYEFDDFFVHVLRSVGKHF